MVRRGNFTYQIDRRRTKKKKDEAAVEQAFIFGDLPSDDDKDDEEAEDQSSTSSSEEDDDLPTAATAATPSSSKRRGRAKKDTATKPTKRKSEESLAESSSEDDKEEETRRSNRNRTNMSHRSDEDSWNEEDDDLALPSNKQKPNKKKAARPRSAKTTMASKKRSVTGSGGDDSSQKEEEEEEEAAWSSSSHHDDDDYDETIDADIRHNSLATIGRRKQKQQKKAPPSHRKSASASIKTPIRRQKRTGPAVAARSSPRRSTPKRDATTKEQSRTSPRGSSRIVPSYVDIGSSGADDDDDVHSNDDAPPPVASRKKKSKPKEGDDDSRSFSSASSHQPQQLQTTKTTRGRRKTSTRASATRALKRLQSETSSNDSDNPSDDEHMSSSSPNHNNKMSSDEEFLDDSASEPSLDKAVFEPSDSEDDDSLLDEDDDHVILPRNPTKSKATTTIDSDGIGSADESSCSSASDSNQRQKEKKVTHRSNSKASKRSNKEIRPSPREGRFDTSSSSSDDDITTSPVVHRSQCPSTEDAITMEPLPAKHICYIAPDGISRQCFCLSTLRRIALMKTQLPTRIDIDQTIKETFLQPPHFRTAMSDDLLDQIASQFGREALDIRGEFYTRPTGRPNVQRNDLSGNVGVAAYDDDEGDDGFIAEEFDEYMQRYISRLMGSRDVYACPLCYSAVHRRITNTDSGEGSGSDENDDQCTQVVDKIDPMTVLGWVDSDSFQAASLFCFSKVVDVKKHLRAAHNVDTSGIDGNDLYKRYQVRASDGLLQRFLKSKQRRFGSFQGDMARYWSSGHNQSYVFLLDQMDHAVPRMLENETSEDDGERTQAENYMSAAKNLVESIQEHATRHWTTLTSPFLKVSNEDLGDFIAEDDEEEVEDETPHFLARRALNGNEEDLSDQNDFTHRLERKYAQNQHHASSEDEESEEEIDVMELSDGQAAAYCSSEEEKDEWIENLERKRKRRTSTPTAATATASRSVNDDTKRSPSTPVGKKLTKKGKRNGSTPKTVMRVSKVTPVSARRAIKEDSDDEF